MVSWTQHWMAHLLTLHHKKSKQNHAHQDQGKLYICFRLKILKLGTGTIAIMTQTTIMVVVSVFSLAFNDTLNNLFLKYLFWNILFCSELPIASLLYIKSCFNSVFLIVQGTQHLRVHRQNPQHRRGERFLLPVSSVSLVSVRIYFIF